MEHPRVIIYKLLLRLHRHFEENRATRFQIALLALVFACLWWVIGILAGSVLAFFVLFIAPGWPAVYALVGTILVCGVFGMYQSWKAYRRKVAEIGVSPHDL